MSGSIAERMPISSYLYFVVFIISWIYPIIAHWCWSVNGWLKLLDYHDFAGCGPVHIVGGICGLFGAYMIGPRLGKFDTN